MDGALAGRQNRGVENRRKRFFHDGAPVSKKNELRPHLSKYWKIPPDHCAAFVAAMEDILDLYHLPYDPAVPRVCMDESSRQLIGEVKAPMACAPGCVKRVDPEYGRNGVAQIFMEVEPPSGQRRLTSQR